MTKISLLSQLLTGCVMATLLSTSSCNSPKPTPIDQNKVSAVDNLNVKDTQNVKKAVAMVKGFKDENIKGTVTFTQQLNRVLIVADIDGLTPGKHGFHIHENGDCSNADATGGHFNPTNKKHGGPDSPERHVGDFGNIVADSKGHAHYERVDAIISLNGKDTIVGRSIVIHSGVDDFTSQPAGNSGEKIACGIIEKE